MYHAIPPHPNSKHQLTEYLSNRGESKLEAFHDRFAHFANCNMRNTLADNLNLAGTARYNLSIRHKRRLLVLHENPRTAEDRRKIAAAWERIPPFFNHTELWYVNSLAAAVDVAVPFPYAEKLQEDNGERFFSEYLTLHLPTLKTFDNLDRCLCSKCRPAILVNVPPPQPPSLVPCSATTPVHVSAKPLPTIPPPPLVQTGTSHNTNAALQEQLIRKPPPPPPIQYPPFTSMIIAPYPLSFYATLPSVPLYVVPPRLPCCTKYVSWLRRRVGRPLHDPHCQYRNNQLGAKSAPG
jgi:hypothetical protein